jgi:hypothetical protein
LRGKVVEAAHVAVHHLEKLDNLDMRWRASTAFLPRYFGFGQAFATLIEDEGLQVHTASPGSVWGDGQAVEIGLCRDIQETSSALLIPDLRSLGVVAHDPSGAELRFFAGVPLVSGPVGIGTICFVDRAPHQFCAEDFSLLEALGRRASAVMSGQAEEVPPIWTSAGQMTREGLGVVLASELSRAENRSARLRLLVFAGSAPHPPRFPRTVIAQLGPDRFAVLVARDEESFDFLQQIDANEFLGGGLVEIEGRAGALFDARSILYAAERLLESTLQNAPGTIERILFRREPHAVELQRTST